MYSERKREECIRGQEETRFSDRNVKPGLRERQKWAVVEQYTKRELTKEGRRSRRMPHKRNRKAGC